MDLKTMPDSTKGLILIIIGGIVLLDVLNIFKQSLYYALLIGSIILIIYGFILGGFWEKLEAMIKTPKKK